MSNHRQRKEDDKDNSCSEGRLVIVCVAYTLDERIAARFEIYLQLRDLRRVGYVETWGERHIGPPRRGMELPRRREKITKKQVEYDMESDPRKRVAARD